MNARAIKDLHNEWYLKILSKLHEPLGEYNWPLLYDWENYFIVIGWEQAYLILNSLLILI